MIDFKPIKIEDKDKYEKLLFSDSEKGCEYSFANLFLWGRQKIATVDNDIVLFSQFNRRTVYPYPIGKSDKKSVIEKLILDSEERGISLRITGLGQNEIEFISKTFPDKFIFHCDRDSYDYIYDINDLADLTGKKYDGKRNHIKKFYSLFPDAIIEPITHNNINNVEKMAQKWYEEKTQANPEGDFAMEKAALNKAFKNFDKLGLEGIAIKNGGEVIAFTIGSRISNSTFDVHFEKAVSIAQGAYAVINQAFAKHIRQNHPNILYLNREEDMGIEGLRKAKLSYNPHHLVEKCWAHLMEDGYDY